MANEPLPLLNVKEPTPRLSPRQQAWLELKRLAPMLWQIEPRRVNETPPPRALPDGLFLQLVACLADTRKRAILRKLLFDLLADDVQQLIENPYEESST